MQCGIFSVLLQTAGHVLAKRSVHFHDCFDSMSVDNKSHPSLCNNLCEDGWLKVRKQPPGSSAGETLLSEAHSKPKCFFLFTEKSHAALRRA